MTKATYSLYINISTVFTGNLWLVNLNLHNTKRDLEFKLER